MKAPIDRVTVVLTARQARALQDHLKATVPRDGTQQSDLEKAHSALVEALCRAVSRAVLKGDKPS